MTTNQLNWRLLQPNLEPYTTIFEQATKLEAQNMMELQPRLESALKLFCQQQHPSNFMLVNTEDSRAYLSLIAEQVKQQMTQLTSSLGGYYKINGQQACWFSTENPEKQFAVSANCLYEEWFEHEQLLGCVRRAADSYLLQPGLIHKTNGGILILSLKTLLAQPLLWFRLRQIVASQQGFWFSPDETKPLPLSIQPMPLSLRIILVGDSMNLADLQELEPELTTNAVYAEFEDELTLNGEDDMIRWCSYVNAIAKKHQLPKLAVDAYPLLINEAVKISGDQQKLLLSPVWLAQQLRAASHYRQDEDLITADVFLTALQQKCWRENYLVEKIRAEIMQGQLRIETEGYVIGQINGLSVLEYPGHPNALGEPSRISCVVHFGDGDIADVERKAELGGNIHAKGMMIMHAFISSELASDQQIPFSASIVFEQSYGEVDGDSASLAELCAFISALSLQPINQQIAVTGSVDQFGNVQAIGGINEKIEAFFDICQQRGLTHSQGVIIPASNVRHLCLANHILEAVKEKRFHLWFVGHVADALPILTELPYRDSNKPSLLAIIQARIEQVNSGHRYRHPWFLKWLS